MSKMEKYGKNGSLIAFSDYVSNGVKEVGNDFGLAVEYTGIVREKRGKLPDSVFLLQAFSARLAIRPDYSAATYRLFHYLISINGYENFLSIDIETITEYLGISKSAVKRGLKKLEKDNIVIKIANKTDKRRNDYFMNPMALWKGKAIVRDKYLKKAKDNKLQLDMFSGV